MATTVSGTGLTEATRSTAVLAAERRLAAQLRSDLGGRAHVYSDRVLAGTSRTIDHVVIATSGVWIIDAKDYAGLVEMRNVGGPVHRDLRLYVGGVDRTKLIGAMQWQHDAVVDALEPTGLEATPVHRALCFINSDSALRAKPFQLDGVWVIGAQKLTDLILEPGSVDAADIDTIAAAVATKLPAVERSNERRNRG